ncbi:MAG TPA: hypothetical protein VN083_04415, partial [Vicinamibacteria bacterium]|nr:hypothetical protein [Vicinamibacteria bacterium]
LSGPWGVRISPFFIASTGRPFNITVGRDLNGDSLFTDRPAFATDPSNPRVVSTPYGLLDPNPVPGETLIPRNFGEGPGFLVLNLRISRTIPFGRQPGPRDPGGDGPRSTPFQPRPEGFARGRDQESGGRGLTITLSAQNLLNYVNPAAPVGNLSSPFFGRSLSNAGGFGFGPGGGAYSGNRRIELQARYSF